MKKFHVVFELATLPLRQPLYVIAPSEQAVRRFIRRESPGCEVISIAETDDKTKVYAESDVNGNRL